MTKNQRTEVKAVLGIDKLMVKADGSVHKLYFNHPHSQEASNKWLLAGESVDQFLAENPDLHRLAWV